MSHTWYFKSPKLVDFHNPSERRYPWLAWNHEPTQKPYCKSNDQNLLVPWGTPVYEYERSLICRRYFPPEAVLTEITDNVELQCGEEFFRDPDWRQKLREQHTTLMNRYEGQGRYESCDEYEKRVFDEIAEAKAIIDKELNKSVEYICWPGGGYNETVISAARKLGFKAWTLASRDQSTFRNRPGVESNQIKRIGSSVKYLTQQGLDCGYAGQYFFLSNIERHKGSVFAKWFSRLLRLIAILRARFA